MENFTAVSIEPLNTIDRQVVFLYELTGLAEESGSDVVSLNLYERGVISGFSIVTNSASYDVDFYESSGYQAIHKILSYEITAQSYSDSDVKQIFVNTQGDSCLYFAITNNGLTPFGTVYLKLIVSAL